MLLGKLIAFKVKCKNSLRQGASGGADVAFCRSSTANETQIAAAIFHFIGDLSMFLLLAAEIATSGLVLLSNHSTCIKSVAHNNCLSVYPRLHVSAVTASHHQVFYKLRYR
jgi:hypothetical protein